MRASGREATIETSAGPPPEGDVPGDAPVELKDTIVIETTGGKRLEFEIVGIVEDEDDESFAVAYCEAEDEFVVTDARGTLLDDDELAQEILDDFFVLAEESGEEN